MPPTWELRNQECLLAEVARVRALLESHLAGLAPSLPAVPAMDPPSTAGQLAEAFQLSAFEKDLLLLCASVELDPEMATLCAKLQGLTGRANPTFSIALAALPDPHWSALAPTSALRRWQLIEVAAGDSLLYSPLRLPERVLHYLTGVRSLEEKLLDYVAPVQAPGRLPKSYDELASQAAAIWTQCRGKSEFPVLLLCGRETEAKRDIAAAAAARFGCDLHSIRAQTIPAIPREAAALARMWEREAVLSTSALLIEYDDLERAEALRAAALAGDLRGLVFLSVRDPLQIARRTAIRLDVDKPTRTEQTELWNAGMGAWLNGRLESTVSHFHFSPQAIRSVCLAVASSAEAPERALWKACVAHSRPRLGELAERIEARATSQDLILPQTLRTALEEILMQVRQRPVVHEAWGFEKKNSRGMGLGVLFAGPSGTGKTMAAEVLANELAMDLYRIDLSAVVSKYIGETEKNLRRVFDAAEDGGVVLLFDEADALFGKRSEVRDSHDRYANIEVSYLLQRMEAYRGLAILTTNQKGALDSAFTRRLRFMLDFPFPGVPERAAIWQRVFPADTPLGEIAWQKLARLNISGGHIRNIALGAAFRAAEDTRRVEMKHLLAAARSEYFKLDRALPDREIEDWLR